MPTFEISDVIDIESSKRKKYH